MGVIEDVMKALERIPLWRRLALMPKQMEQMQARLDALEQKLAGKDGPQCPVCMAPGFRRTATAPDPVMGDLGVMQDTHQCPSCQHSETRMRDSMQQ